PAHRLAFHRVRGHLDDLGIGMGEEEAQELASDVTGATDDRDLHRRPTPTAWSTIRPATSTPVAAASALNSGVGLTSWTVSPWGDSIRSTARTPPPTARAARKDRSESSGVSGVASVVAPRAALVRHPAECRYMAATTSS